MKRIFYGLICLFFLLVLHGHAQDFSNKGKEFWLAYSYHVGMVNGGGQPIMTLYITSDVNTTYNVEVFGTATLQSGTINAGQVVTVNVPNSYFINDEGLFNGKAIRVSAEKPVVVYSFITRSAASAASLCLPTTVLGREYYSVNFTQTSNEPNSHSFITIVGVEDNTTVEVTPTGDTKNGWVSGTTYTVNLNKGTIYQVLGSVRDNNNAVDLTGTRIRSVASGSAGCKRIAVFSGSGKMLIGGNCQINQTPGADNLYQQLYPTGTWGKKYLTAPSVGRPNNYYRIIKKDPTTNVYLNGTLIPATSFVNDVYYEFLNNIPNLVEADQPITVAQYFTSQGCAGNNGPNDPDMIVLNPVEQNIDKVTLVTTSLVNSPAQHNIHVIMPNAGTGLSTFKLDGVVVPATVWTVHPSNPAYSYAYLTNVSQGNHRLESDSGFNAVVYGYANVETYGYSAGANVKDLYQFVSIQNQFATVNYPSTCKDAPFFFSMTFPYQPTQIKWVFGAALNAMGINDVTNNAPVFDSTWFVNGKQLYRYKISTPYLISAVGTYSIKVLAQNPTADGCSGEQEINYDVQVFDRPVAGFNFTTSGCVSDSVRFTDNANTFGQPAVKWNWVFDDGQSSTIKNPAHLYTAAKTYNVKFSLVTDIGCVSDTVSKPVTLSQPPLAKFGISSPYCAGKALTVSDSSTTTGSAIVKWTWNFGDGTAAVISTTNSSQTHNYANPGPYTITLVVENANGCKSIVASKTITVSANPVVGFNFGKACLPNGALQFTDVSTIGDGTQNLFSYSWNFGDGGVAQTNNPVHNFTSVGPHTVSLLITSSAGCKDSITKTVDSVFAQPQARFTAPPDVCFGTTVNFTDQSTAQNSTITGWQWNFGDGAPNSSAQNPSHNYTAPGIYTVTLTTTSAAGCVSAPETKQVIVNALPTVNFTPASPACVNGSITFTDNSTTGSGTINKWKWTFGDGTATSTQQSPTYTYTSTGSYTVSLQVETDKGCVSTVLPKQVVVNPVPVPGFVMPGNCVNDPITQFVDTSSIADGSQAQFTYLWNFGDANANAGNPNTSTIKNATHKFTATGDYNVTLTVTSNNGCFASQSQKFTINGAVPVSTFTVQNGSQHCSNDSIFLTDNSSVTPGRLVKLEIFWDYGGDQTSKTVVDNPVPGTTYRHKYPEFFTPASKSYVVRMVSYSGISCQSFSEQTVTINATPDINFPAITSVCADAVSFQVQANTLNMTGGTGVFTGTGITAPGMFNPRISGAGTYPISYTYTSTNGCTSAKSQDLIISPVPTINAGPDRFVLEGGSVTINTTASGSSLSYLWTPSTYLNNATAAQPVAMPQSDILYKVVVTSAAGCSATDEVSVKLLKSLVIPNVFSPNGDGINDKWDVKYLESYPGATIDIFNRYGQKVFQSIGYSRPWDGTYKGSQVPAGTYYYIINPKNGRQQMAGYVDIIR
jgi:gliding motility-associated-like protein